MTPEGSLTMLRSTATFPEVCHHQMPLICQTPIWWVILAAATKCHQTLKFCGEPISTQTTSNQSLKTFWQLSQLSLTITKIWAGKMLRMLICTKNHITSHSWNKLLKQRSTPLMLIAATFLNSINLCTGSWRITQPMWFLSSIWSLCKCSRSTSLKTTTLTECKDQTCLITSKANKSSRLDHTTWKRFTKFVS